VLGYFVYYRFINPAIVTPDLYNIIRLNLPPTQRKSLAQVGRVLQSLFNFTNVGSTVNLQMARINDFVLANKDRVAKYLSQVVDVPQPADHLMVDQYIELTQQTKPIVLMSYHEVYSTHEVLLKNLNVLAPSKEDPLRVIIEGLGPLPEYDLSEEELHREVQLTLVNRFTEETAAQQLKRDKISKEERTRNLFMDLMKALPFDNSSINLLDILQVAKTLKDPVVEKLVAKINRQLDKLEKAGTKGKTRQEICAALHADITQYVENQAALRLQKANIIRRLRLGLENLRKAYKFMTEQMESFNTYLRVAQEKQQAAKPSKQNERFFFFFIFF
jgi:Ras GTPase-activating-like protein IQGAP2/3